MKNRRGWIIFLLLIFVLEFSFFFQTNNIFYYEQDENDYRNISLHLSVGEPVSFEWNRTWGGNYEQYASDIALDSLDNIFLVGWTWNFETKNDMCLVKYDNAGNYQWHRIWGGNNRDSGRAIAIDSSDNIYIVGTTLSFGAGGRDMFLVKYDHFGVQQWNCTWGGSDWDWGFTIALDSLGYIFLAGSTSSFGAGSFDFCLIKYDDTGGQLWNRTWGGISSDRCMAIAIDTSNNIYLSGDTSSFETDSYDFCLVKFSNTGDCQWNRTWGEGSRDECFAVAVDSSDNIYLTGDTWSIDASSYDFCLVKYSSSGDYQWNRTWGGIYNDQCFAMAIDTSDNIYLAGYTNVDLGPSCNSDICLVKYNSSGEYQWNLTWGRNTIWGEATCEVSSGIALDSLGNIFLAGSTGTYGSKEYDMILLKIPNPSVIAIPGYNLIVLICLICVVSIIFIRNRHKLLN